MANTPSIRIKQPLINKGVSWPKISIITPTYNQGEFIEDTIISILNQEYPNLEYIVIDGGSTDNSVDIIKKYASKISYWISERDEGQSDAINKGFRQSNGDIINWINSDDLLADGALFKIANYFVEHNPELLVGGSLHWDAIRNISFPHTTDPITYRDLLRYNETICLAQPSVFYSRKLLLKAGFLNQKLHYTMDLDLWFRFGIINGIDKKLNRLNDLISLMRIQPDQKTTKMNFLAMKEASKVVMYYSKKYKLNFKHRLILYFKYRRFRFDLAKQKIDRLIFVDVLFLKLINKLFKWKV